MKEKSVLFEIKSRYQNDAEFHNLVNVLMQFMSDNRFTPSEIKDAIFLAGIILHEQSVSISGRVQ